MCRPSHYNICYTINPWMDITNEAEYLPSQNEWQTLHHTIIRLGGWVEYVDPQPGFPDMVFTANAGLIYKNKCVVSNFKFFERQGEEVHYRHHLGQFYETLRLSKELHFEGAGDALFAGDVLFAGYGFRSDIEAIDEVADMLDVNEVVKCQLIDSRFYHLDTCFCPLNDKQAIYFPGAFPNETIEIMKDHLEMIEVLEEDAVKFACNAVVLGENIIIPEGCENTKRLLQDLGFDVYSCRMNEYIKAGGACKCLTLQLV